MHTAERATLVFLFNVFSMVPSLYLIYVLLTEQTRRLDHQDDDEQYECERIGECCPACAFDEVLADTYYESSYYSARNGSDTSPFPAEIEDPNAKNKAVSITILTIFSLTSW